MARLYITLFSLLAMMPMYSAATESHQWIAGWQATSTLNVARAGAAVIKHNQMIYVLGGVDGHDFLRSVEYSLINPDGSLQPWRFTHALNEARGFFDAAIIDNILYVVGGGNGPNGKHLLRSIERALINPDGSLGHWETQLSTLKLPRRCVKLMAYEKRLFALGGFGGTLLDSVESAAMMPDGTLGPWQIEQRQMTMPRYVNTAKHIDDHAIVIGGHREQGGVGLRAVETARLDKQGIATNWQSDAALNIGRYALSSATDGNNLWAIGGLDGAIYSDQIEKTSYDKNSQRLMPWQETTSLSSPRANFGAVVGNGFIYIIGGTNRDGYYKTVELARINDQGDPGFYGSWAQAEQYASRKALTRHTELPNSGQVVEVIQTTSYSYLKVMGEGGARWLAAPLGDYAPDDTIYFSRGLTMTNFYSRSLGRQFDQILFVEQAEKAKQD